MDAEELTDEVANALENVPKGSQATLISVLGHRAASHRIDTVFPYVEDQNESVRIAALTALQQMASQKDLPRLFLY